MFYQIKEREVGGDENEITNALNAENENDEPEEGTQDAAKVHEISVGAQFSFDCGQNPSGVSPVHSIVWEDLEPMEG